jgi:hypothetical protein
VKKFVDLLQGFEFYLMMEPELRKVSSIKETLTPLNVDFVDNFLIKQGAGGNILAIRK